MPQVTNQPLDRCPPGLEDGGKWIKRRLEETDLEYASDGEVVGLPWASGNLSVHAPYSDDGPEIEAAYRQMSQLWQTGETIVYGRGASDGGGSFLYWRAGGVDHRIQSDLALDRVETESRPGIDQMISRAEATPYA